MTAEQQMASGIVSPWIPVSQRMPTERDAMVFARNPPPPGEDAGDGSWLGAVMGLCRGKEIPVLVLYCVDGVRLAPMMEDGLLHEADVTAWKPWPRVDMAMPVFPVVRGDAPEYELNSLSRFVV